MKQGLTKREKLFLLIAGLLLLMYLAFQFGFVPLYNKYSELKAERDLLNAQRVELELKILNLQSIEEANNIANDEFAEITKDYPLLITNEEIDTVLTNLILSTGMSITSVRFFTPPSDDDSVLFTIVGATMSVQGSYVSLLQLLDEVETIPNMSITTMTFSESRGNANDIEGFVRGQGTMTLGFELMYITPTD